MAQGDKTKKKNNALKNRLLFSMSLMVLTRSVVRNIFFESQTGAVAIPKHYIYKKGCRFFSIHTEIPQRSDLCVCVCFFFRFQESGSVYFSGVLFCFVLPLRVQAQQNIATQGESFRYTAATWKTALPTVLVR